MVDEQKLRSIRGRVRLITAVMEEDAGRRMDAEVIADGLQELRWSLGEADIMLDVIPRTGRR